MIGRSTSASRRCLSSGIDRLLAEQLNQVNRALEASEHHQALANDCQRSRELIQSLNQSAQSFLFQLKQKAQSILEQDTGAELSKITISLDVQAIRDLNEASMGFEGLTPATTLNLNLATTLSAQIGFILADLDLTIQNSGSRSKEAGSFYQQGMDLLQRILESQRQIREQVLRKL